MKILLLLSVLSFANGCEMFSNSKEEVEARFEKFLEVDIPSNFIVETQEEYFAEYSFHYTIRYKNTDFDEFVKRLNLSDWDQTYVDVSNLYKLKKTIDERAYCVIDLSISANTLSLLCWRD